MIYVSVEATVKRRPEVVWDVLSDVASATAWIEGRVAVEPDDDGARPGVGCTMNVVRRDGARSVAASSEIAPGDRDALVKRIEATSERPYR